MKKNKPVSIYYGQTVFITTLLLLTTFTAIGTIDDSIAHESTITQLYTFDVPSINQVTINEEIFDQIQISNAPSCGQPGEPLLPALGISLLLPQGMEITKIDVVPGQRMFLGSGFRIEPVREPRKISEPQVDNSILIDDIISNVIIVVDILKNTSHKSTDIKMINNLHLADVGSVKSGIIDLHSLEGVSEIQLQMPSQV